MAAEQGTGVPPDTGRSAARGPARHGHGGGVVRVVAGDGAGEVVAPSVPGYELGTLLARGGTSEVWAAVEERSARRVAVKVVRAEVDALEVASREAALSARAASAHVVAVEACLPLADGRAALVMPLVGGGPLDALIRARGHLSAGEVVTVLAPLASALGRLHERGVVHGDVSPGNVLLELDGRPLLGDLGLGHVVGETAHAVWGTEGFVAPEVVLGSAPGPAADVYALGAIGWLCVSGQVPGPPGLRPTLAEVSRAGARAAAVVEVLQSAVEPMTPERPTAHELAWRLFDAARPEPLHLVRGEDETSAVTYRLRAAAEAVDPEDDARVPLRRRLRRVLAVRRRAEEVDVRRPVPVSTLLRQADQGERALADSTAGGRRAARHARVRQAGTGRRRPVLGSPSGPGGRRGEAVARRRRPTVRTLVALGGVGVTALVLTALVLAPGLIRPAQPAPARDRPVAAAAAPGTPPGSVADVRTDPAGARERPAALLAALADARATAWREATAAHLQGADAPGSAALARDLALVTDLARSGLRYTGLRHTVRDARLVAAEDDRASVRARIDTSAYTVTGPTGSTPRPAVRGEEVVVALVLTDVGWRVSDVGRPP